MAETGHAPLIGPRRGIVQLGNLTLNRDTFHVSVGARPVVLGSHEYDLLETMALQPDLIISTEDLTRLLWGEYNRPCRRRLAVMVFRLRVKLDGIGPYQIESARGRGYGLVLNETVGGAGKLTSGSVFNAGRHPTSGR